MGIYRDQKSGNWGIRIKHYGKDCKKIIGPDKRKAQLALDEVKAEIRLAKLAGQDWDGFAKLQRAKRPKNFKEAAAEYLAQRPDLKPSSVDSYTSIFRCHLMPKFGNTDLRSISSSMIRVFQSDLNKSGRRTASRINTIMQPLRSVLAQAYRDGEIDHDPSLSVRPLVRTKTVIDPLSEAELSKVLQNIDPHFRPLFTALAYTGARPNELIALRWHDIDWTNRTISISKGRVRGREGRPKTASSQRKIPMLEPVEQVLKDLKSRAVVSIDSYIFTKANGSPIDKHLDRVWTRALKKASIRHRPSYQLRHTFATQLIVKGFPLPYVANLLGHTTIETLVRHYAGWIHDHTKQQELRLRMSFSTLPEEGTPQLAHGQGKVEVKVEGSSANIH